MKHTLTKLFTASLVVVMGQSVLGAMQDQDEIIDKAIKKGKNKEGVVVKLSLEKIPDDRNSGKITNAGLKKLAGRNELIQLKQLKLSGTKITNLGLFHVAKLEKLERLTLVGCDKITDAGLQHLHKLTNLKEVRLRGTAVSSEGIAKLRKALPNCENIPNDFEK